MIDNNEKENCCGCASCVNICPKECITMVEDEEGFLYPKINKEKCIECGLCIKVCPMLTKKEDNKEHKTVYACINIDEDVLKESSSGGVFKAIANEVLKQNGVVFGALYDSDMNVIHDYITNQKNLIKLQGSKYVQSNIKNSFKDVKKFLNSDKIVLFSGTPCQIAGLKTFLQKDYNNLITCDFICTGVPSPKIYRAFRDYYQDKYKSKITNIHFRHKKNGWINFGMLYELGKKKKYICRYESPYINAMYKHLILRPTCYQCKFKHLNSSSDIKLGDFWLIKNVNPNFYNYNGVSLVIITTDKGNELFNKVKNEFKIYESSYEEIANTNRALYITSTEPKQRKTLFNNIKNVSSKKIVEIVKENTKIPFKQQIHNRIFVIGTNIKNKLFNSK